MNDVEILKRNGVDLEKSLVLLEDMQTYDETLYEFLQHINDKLNDIKKYASEKNLESYSNCVHSLKSDARYLGFTNLANMAMAHEMESSDNNLKYVLDNINSLISEAVKMAEIGKQYLVNLPKSKTNRNDNTPKDVTILVVDDSDLIRGFIHKIFDNSFNVIMADDGQKAIDIINSDTDSKIKAVFLDLNMPNVNGFEVLEYFKTNGLFLKYPVSIITGIDNKDSINRAFEYSIVDMLEKPFTEKDVKRIVERTLSRNK